jgi:uncharacterized protein
LNGLPPMMSSSMERVTGGRIVRCDIPQIQQVFSMQAFPARISDFMSTHHVLSLAVVDGDTPWSASCFYAFEPNTASVLVMTSVKTRHGHAMQSRPIVSATVSEQPERLRDIRGVQFSAFASRLSGAELEAAMDRYLIRHPVARLRPTDLWRLSIEHIKLTDNSLVFARKTIWQRDE